MLSNKHGTCFSPGVNQPVRLSDHSPPSDVEEKNEGVVIPFPSPFFLLSPPSSAVGHERVELYLYSPYGPYDLYGASVPVQRVHFTFTFTGSFPGVKSGRGVTLTPHPLLVPLVMKY